MKICDEGGGGGWGEEYVMWVEGVMCCFVCFVVVAKSAHNQTINQSTNERTNESINQSVSQNPNT